MATKSLCLVLASLNGSNSYKKAVTQPVDSYPNDKKMGRIQAAVVLAILAVSVSSVPTDRKRGPKDLSDETHFAGDKRDHNSDYDHEAFLGDNEAQTFDQLPPAEAKRRLGIIVDKIDKSGDGRVTEQELVDWVRHVAKRYGRNNSDIT